MLAFLSLCVAACRAHGVEILDGVYNDFSNEAGLREECAQGRDFGMDGKTLIHPGQIGPCNEIFAPTAAELAWSRTIMSVFDPAGKREQGARCRSRAGWWNGCTPTWRGARSPSPERSTLSHERSLT